MPLEHEIKFAVPDLDALRTKLKQAGAVRLGRVFESNQVYDDANGSLRAAGILLRLRQDGQARLTVKVPPDAQEDQPGLKVMRELETVVADGAAMESMLLALGYRAIFAYQKVRETWDLAICSPGGNPAEHVCHVCLDELPFGDFVELEGPAECLPEAAQILGFAMQNGLTQTYHALHQQHLRDNNLPLSDSFVFPPAKRQELLDQLGHLRGQLD